MRTESSNPNKKAQAAILRLMLTLGLFVLIIMPRLGVVAETVTIDEDKWLTRSANFRYALQTKNWRDTYQKEHPGVTAMWAGALGLSYLLQDSQVPFDQTSQPDLIHLLQANGYALLDGLIAARVVMVLFNGLVLLLAFLYTQRLLGTAVAITAILLIAFSPFYAGHTHLLHLDGLVGSLMLLSILAFVHYVNGRRRFDLVLSGIAAGMACLTKSTGFLLIPIMTLIVLLLEILPLRNHTASWRPTVRDSFFMLAIWACVSLVTFVILWPAMWVSPGETLKRMFTAVVDYSSGGHSNPIFFNGEIYGVGEQISRLANFYPITYLWRTTPVTLAGLLLTTIALIRGKFRPNTAQRHTLVALIVSTAIIFFWLNLGNKKFDRYLLPVYGLLALIAAIGWGAFAAWLQNHRPVNFPLRLGWIALLLVIFIQSIFMVQSYPYYLSFYNPLLGGSSEAPKVMMIGWGEALDAAAEYLNEKPDAASLSVASWYRPSFAYFFDGKSIDIPSFPTPEQEAEIVTADYIVIYIHQWQRNLPSQLLAELEGQIPEHIIWFNGLEYARIYSLSGKGPDIR